MLSVKKSEIPIENPLTGIDSELSAALYHTAPEAMFILDSRHDTVVDCNEKAVMLFEAEKKEHISGHSLFEFIEHGPTELLRDLLEMKMQNGGNFTQDLSFCTAQHNTFWGSMDARRFSLTNRNFILLRITKFMDFHDSKDILPSLLKGTAKFTGKRYFKELTRLMSRSFSADYAFIGIFSEDRRHVNIIESYSESKKPLRKKFGVEGTFFENMMLGNTIIFPKGIKKMFPDMKYLQENNIESFLGVPIFGNDAEVSGVLGFMSLNNMKELPGMQNIVSLFAARIANELQQSRSKEILHHQARELTASNAVKDKLLNVISDDLLDPLQTIMEFSATLRRNMEKYDKEKITERMEIIDNSIRNIYFMLDNLSCWVNFYQDTIHVTRDFLSVNALIRENLSHFRYIIEAKELEMLTPEDDAVIIYTDKNMFSSMIRNVLSNAVKYIPKGGAVRLTLKEFKSKVKLIIEDNGPGIPPEAMARINHADQCDPELIQTGNRSTGIGLLLSQLQARCIGGSLDINTVEEKGTVVTITVPR